VQQTLQLYGTNNTVAAHWDVSGNPAPRFGVVVGGPWLLDDSKTTWKIGDDGVGDSTRYLMETQVASVAGRFRFYVTQLTNGDSAKSSKRHDEIEEIKRRVKSRVRPNELPPIVVGDFNFSVNGGAKDEPGNRSALEADFYLASKVGTYCYDSIHGAIPYNQIWIGKASSFPTTKGSFTAVRFHTVGTPTGIQLMDPVTLYGVAFPNGLTDHREAVAISFVTDSTGRVNDVPWGIPTPPLIYTQNLPQGVTYHPYAAAISVVGGRAPLTWLVDGGALPPGLTLSVATGVLSGTPSTHGNYSFTLRVRDSSTSTLTDTQLLRLAIR